MIKIFLALILVFLLVGGASYWKLQSNREAEEQERAKIAAAAREAREANSQVKVEVTQGESVLVPEIRVVPSDINSPVLETKEGSVRVGNLIESGQVKAVRDGIAKVEWEGQRSYLVTSQSETKTQAVSVVGRVFDDSGLEKAMTADGTILQEGRMSAFGMVVRLTEERADVRRQDGGWLFLVFSAIRDDDKSRFLVDSSTTSGGSSDSLISVGSKGPNVQPPSTFSNGRGN